MTNRVAIASAVRTPFTRALKGEFKDTRPDTLGAVAQPRCSKSIALLTDGQDSSGGGLGDRGIRATAQCFP